MSNCYWNTDDTDAAQAQIKQILKSNEAIPLLRGG